jgi:hypothetical protein
MGYDREAILWDWPLAMINVFEHCQLYSQGIRLAGSSNTEKVTEAMLQLKQRVKQWICP